MGLEFLKHISPELDQTGQDIERLLFKEPQAVLSKSRIVVEILAKLLNKQEGIDEIFEVKQAERVQKLEKRGIIDKEQRQAFDWIRREGNKAAHEPNYGNVELAIQAHRCIYDLAGWYIECYGEVSFTLPPYKLPTVEEAGVNKVDIKNVFAQLMDEKMTPLFESLVRKMEETKAVQIVTEEAVTKVQKKSTNKFNNDGANYNLDTIEEKKEEPGEQDQDIQLKKIMLLDYLQNTLQLSIIYNREKKDPLWVLGGWDLNKQLLPLKKEKIFFRFSKKGTKATNNQPGWFLLNKKNVDKLFVIVEADLPIQQKKEESQKENTVGLKDYLIQQGLEILDETGLGGSLWIIGDWSLSTILSPLKKRKIFFRFVKKGSKSTNYQPAWRLLNKKLDHLYVKERIEQFEGKNQEKVEDNDKDVQVNEKNGVIDKSATTQERNSIKDSTVCNKAESVDEVETNKVAGHIKTSQPDVIETINHNVEQIPIRRVITKKHEEKGQSKLKYFPYVVFKPLQTYYFDALILPAEADETKTLLKQNNKLQTLLTDAGINKEVQQLTLNDFRALYRSNQTQFIQVIQFLSIYGIRFVGALHQFVPFETVENDGYIVVKDEKKELKAYLTAQYREVLASYGIVRMAQLNGVTVSALRYMFKSFEEFPLTLKEQYVEKDEEDHKVVFFLNGDSYKMDSFVLDAPLSLDLFKGVNSLLLQLQEKGYHVVRDLPDDLSPFQETLTGVGVGRIKKFLTLLKALSVEDLSREEREGIVSERLSISLGKELITVSDDHLAVRISTISFQSVNRLLRALHDNNIETLGQLPAHLERVKEYKGVGKGVVEKFFEQLGKEIKRLDEQIRFQKLSKEERMAELIVGLREELQNGSILSENQLAILQLRFERKKEGKSYTLEVIGQIHGITRERVRQIRKKALANIAAAGQRLLKELEANVKETGWIRNEWFDSSQFYDDVVIDTIEEQGNIYFEHESNLFTSQSRLELDEEKSKITSDITQAFRAKEAYYNEIDVWLKANTNWNTDRRNYFISETFVQTQTEKKGYVLKRSSKLDLGEIVLSYYPNGVEVYKRAEELNRRGNQLIPNSFISNRDFSALCSREEAVDRIYLWKRGTYIHRQFVPVPYDLLREIEGNIESRFKELSSLQIRIVYETFANRLADEGIPSEYALYTLLRNHGYHSFYLPKYPLITKEKEEFQSNIDRIEAFIRQQNGHASLRELRHEFVKRQGWKDYTLQLNLSDRRFLSVDYGQYALPEVYDDIDKDNFEDIYDSLEQQINEKEWMFIYQTYHAFEVQLTSKGIGNVRLFYELLSNRYSGEVLRFIRYPFISKHGSPVEAVSKEVLIEGYLKEEKHEVQREDVIAFVEQVGGKAAFVDHVLTKSKDIYYYTRGQYGEYVHKETLGWSNEKAKQLERDVLAIIRQSDEQYVQSEDVFYCVSKPELDNGLSWTLDLFVDLLLKGEDSPFVEIGTQRLILAEKDTFKDNAAFIHTVIRNQFNGTVKKTTLEQFLREIGYSKRGTLGVVLDRAVEAKETPFLQFGDEYLLKIEYKE